MIAVNRKLKSLILVLGWPSMGRPGAQRSCTRLYSSPAAQWSLLTLKSNLALNSKVIQITKDIGRSPCSLSPPPPFVGYGRPSRSRALQPLGLPIHWREEQEIAWRVRSPLWWANLVWPPVSHVSRVQITVLQSDGFVTVEFWQRPSSWTWTFTTRGITVCSVRTWVRADTSSDLSLK